MKKKNALSIKTYRGTLKLPYELPGGINEVKIKDKIDMRTIVTAANLIAYCVAHYEDDGEFTYAPEVFDFAYGINLCRFFTDLAIPENIEEQMEIVYAPGFISSVECAVGDAAHSLSTGASKRIEFLKSKEIHKTSIEGLAKSLNDLIKTTASKIEDIDVENLLAQIADGSGLNLKDLFSDALNGQNGKQTEEKVK